MSAASVKFIRVCEAQLRILASERKFSAECPYDGGFFLSTFFAAKESGRIDTKFN